MYISLSYINSLQRVVIQMPLYFTPLRHLLLLSHNAGKIALSRIPILQRRPLFHRCQVPPPGPVAFLVCCTYGAIYLSLRVHR